MAPHISSSVDAQRLVAACRYQEPGERGLGPCWSNNYGLSVGMAEYIEWADANTLLLAQIEDEEGIRNLDSIMAQPGLDGIVVGPRDLSHSLGHTGEPNHPDVEAAIAEVIGKAKGMRKWVGLPGANADLARSSLDQGADLIVSYMPGLFVAAAKGFIGEIRSTRGCSVRGE